MTRRSLPDAMALRTQRTPDCWYWTGNVCTTTGYGRLGFQGASLSVHRVAYELAKGPIPEGLVIDHLCREKRCVNPAHLEAVSIRENTLRGDSPPARKIRSAECHRGHPYDEANTIIQRGYRLCRTCRDARSAKRRQVAA